MNILMIIAPEGFQDVEYGTPKKIFESKGYKVTTSSVEKGVCKSKLSKTEDAEIALRDVIVSDYNAIVFVGGPGSKIYQHDGIAHLTLQEAQNQGLVIGAICIAPAILALGGILKEKKATIWNEDNSYEKILTDNGANYTGDSVTVDGKIITANGPEAAEEFANKIVEILENKKEE